MDALLKENDYLSVLVTSMINELNHSSCWLECKNLPKIVCSDRTHMRISRKSIGILLPSALFILVVLSWCYWWISLLDLWTEESCWLFSFALPSSAKYWCLFHSLSCTVFIKQRLYLTLDLPYTPLSVCFLFLLNSTICAFFMLPILSLMWARDFVIKSFGGSIKFVCQGEGRLLFCLLSNNVEIIEQPLKKLKFNNWRRKNSQI